LFHFLTQWPLSLGSDALRHPTRGVRGSLTVETTKPLGKRSSSIANARQHPRPQSAPSHKARTRNKDIATVLEKNSQFLLQLDEPTPVIVKSNTSKLHGMMSHKSMRDTYKVSLEFLKPTTCQRSVSNLTPCLDTSACTG